MMKFNTYLTIFVLNNPKTNERNKIKQLKTKRCEPSTQFQSTTRSQQEVDMAT
jgi:hypothetical protein